MEHPGEVKVYTPIPMKCHLCGQDLTCDNINMWKLEDRYMVGYGCRNTQCRPPASVSTDSSVFMHVVFPDEDVTYYLLRFPHRDKWYQVASSRYDDGGETTFSVSAPNAVTQYVYDPLFKLPRFIPLNWNLPLDTQATALKEKMKTLLYFL